MRQSLPSGRTKQTWTGRILGEMESVEANADQHQSWHISIDFCRPPTSWNIPVFVICIEQLLLLPFDECFYLLRLIRFSLAGALCSAMVTIQWMWQSWPRQITLKGLTRSFTPKENSWDSHWGPLSFKGQKIRTTSEYSIAITVETQRWNMVEPSWPGLAPWQSHRRPLEVFLLPSPENPVYKTAQVYRAYIGGIWLVVQPALPKDWMIQWGSLYVKNPVSSFFSETCLNTPSTCSH